MREKDAQLLVSSIETLPLQPSEEFVERTRQRISHEFHITSAAEFSSIDVHVDLATPTDRDRDRDHANVRRSRNRIGFVAALVATCLLGFVAVQALRSDDEPLRTDTADVADASPDRPVDVVDLEDGSEAATAFAAVEDAYAAHAAGDGDAWFAARFAGAEFNSVDQRLTERGRIEANLALGGEVEVSKCDFLGFDDWPFFLDSGELASGYRFRCESYTTDRILRSAGVGVPEVIDWVVFEGQVIGVVASAELSDVASFDIEFREWLGENRPEGLLYLNNGTNPAELEDIAGEFIAESENYPIATNGP